MTFQNQELFKEITKAFLSFNIFFDMPTFDVVVNTANDDGLFNETTASILKMMMMIYRPKLLHIKCH